ncbi:glycoside hydrolase family 9 protein [Parafilimonas terrae]|nr:glycoside hydrolase family 9 protein [Parafilimonas terrae]
MVIHCAYAQDALLQKQLHQSQYLRFTMKPDSADMGFTRWEKKRATLQRYLPLATDFKSLELQGPGAISVDKNNTVSGQGSVLITTPSSLAKKNPTNRSYASAELVRPLNRENLEAYNRFSVWVYADAPGFNSVFVGCTLYNKGKHEMPTPGRFEGQHFVTVYPNKWTHIIWEIPDLYRDAVTGFSVNIMLTGSPKGASDTLKLYVDNMSIDKVAAENTRGFDLRRNAIAFSNSGYRTNAAKQALAQHTNTIKFQLLDAKHKIVFNGDGRKTGNGFVTMDFTNFKKPGYYTLKIGSLETKPFLIGDDAYLATAWHTLNFFFAERCGYDQPGIHQICHQDVYCVRPDGRKINVSGGWHDAADLTQGVGNTARAGISMLELASTIQHKRPELYKRLLEEARWGLDWTLQTRFGDGYRESGIIIGIWSDNETGTKDDMENKATNTPADNFIAASYCALAVPFYKDDAAFSYLLKKAAIEDYGFAVAKFDSDINEKNETEMNAQAVVAAMYLYRLTKEDRYLNDAARHARVVMQAQQMERRTDWRMPLHGFFYESAKKKRILEYFHRSNEEMMMLGLTMLLHDAPDNADAHLWKASCEAYSDYLKETSTVMSPYGILPAAIYEVNNADFEGIYHEGDAVGMPSMEEYNAETKNGIHLGGDFYLRRFPVAYQFRGFHSVLMEKAKAAFVLADALHDDTLRNIGTRQLEYIVGYNPFAMSTIYGDGYNYPPLYGAYAGDVVGAVPVGIETFENEDAPYMPMQVNATYKEIWTNSTGNVIWLLSKIMKE